jgi:hypothetical protein
MVRLPIGTKVYYSSWDKTGIPTALEKIITGYRERKNGFVYQHADGGFSPGSIGKNVFLTSNEALANARDSTGEFAITSLDCKKKIK